MADYAIRIKTAIENDAAKRKLMELKAECQSTAKQLTELDRKISAIKGNTKLATDLQAAKDAAAATAQQLDNIDAKLADMTAKRAALLANTPGYSGMSQSAINGIAGQQIQNENPALVTQADTASTQYAAQAATVEQLTSAYQDQQSTLARLESQKSSLEGTFAAETAALREENTAQEDERQAAEDSASAEERAGLAAQTRAERVRMAFSRFGSWVGSGMGRMGSLVKSGVSGIFSHFSSGFSRITRLGGYFASRLKRIIFGALVFNAVSAAFRSLVTYFKSALGQSQQFTSAMANLKGAALTAVSPLVQLLTPALTMIANAAATAFSYLAKLISLLTGKSVSSMKAFASSTNAAGKAAKNATTSIDELNIIDQNSGSGTGSTAPNFGFDGKSPLLDSMLESIKGGDWGQAGTLLADKLNGIVDTFDAAAWGQKIGTVLQNGVSFAFHLLYGFDWNGLGSNIATLFNNALGKIDAAQVGALFVEKIALGLRLLGGFLADLDWAQLGKKIGEFFIGAFDQLTAAIQSIDWGKIGRGVRDGLASVDWVGVAQSMFTFIGSAFGGLAAYLVGLFGVAIETIRSYFLQEMESCGGSLILGFFKGILDVLANIAVWIYTNILLPFINGFKAAFGIHSPSTVMSEQGGFLMSGLLNGILSGNPGLQKAIEGIKTMFGGINTFLSGVFTGNWRKAWDGLKSILRGAVNGIIGFINGMVSAVCGGLNAVIGAINNLRFDIPTWVPFFGGKNIGFNIPSISAPQIPYLAQGAVIPANREFMAVLGDQTSGTNVEAPLDTIKQAVAEVLAQSATRDTVVNLTAQLDGDVIYHNQQRVSARRGYPVGLNPSFA